MDERVLILVGESRGRVAFVVEERRSSRGHRRLWLKVFTDWMPPFAPRWYSEDEVQPQCEED